MILHHLVFEEYGAEKPLPLITHFLQTPSCKISVFSPAPGETGCTDS